MCQHTIHNGYNKPAYGSWINANSHPAFQSDREPGHYTFTVKASGGAAEMTHTFGITVANANRAPEIADITNAFVDKGGVIEIPVSALDADGNPLQLTLSSRTAASNRYPTGCRIFLRCVRITRNTAHRSRPESWHGRLPNSHRLERGANFQQPI